MAFFDMTRSVLRQQSAVLHGLTQPVAVRFASDGRVFVAEKDGVIKVFSSLTASTCATNMQMRGRPTDA